ncbi:hypothetical protein C0995_006635 [Termitomyces sp. Mi166|nr:hypothetical protein C0995_006635 [Termitomyces sp. Mi166\
MLTGLHFPSTPSSATPVKCAQAGPSYRPLNSSPLAPKFETPSSPDDSPVAARRRLQFKSRTPSTPLPSSSSRAYARAIGSSGGSVFDGGKTLPPLDPQKAFLREKFKVRCFERAAKARERAVKGKRYLSEPSSDGFDEVMDDDEEEDDDAIMADELFRRIVNHSNRKARHSYRLSYAEEVGSSFDPDLEDPEEWENELTASGSGRSSLDVSEDAEEPTPDDLDDEELEAYAEEYARRAALADFEDLSQDELFSLSDVEDLMHSNNSHGAVNEDVDMHC